MAESQNIQAEKKYETLFTGEVDNKHYKIQQETGEFNGHPYSKLLIEEWSIREDGQPFTKMVKDEQGQTHFVPDVKRSTILTRHFDLLKQVLK